MPSRWWQLRVFYGYLWVLANKPKLNSPGYCGTSSVSRKSSASGSTQSVGGATRGRKAFRSRSRSGLVFCGGKLRRSLSGSRGGRSENLHSGRIHPLRDSSGPRLGSSCDGALARQQTRPKCAEAVSVDRLADRAEHRNRRVGCLAAVGSRMNQLGCCRSCRYAQDRRCHKHPISSRDDWGNPYLEFPIINDLDWCSEYWNPGTGLDDISIDDDEKKIRGCRYPKRPSDD